MKLTIYNTYVVMESQEQCFRMRKLCIENKLPHWYCIGFLFYNSGKEAFNFSIDTKEFFVYPIDTNKKDFLNKTKVTEQEFINLLNTK